MQTFDAFACCLQYDLRVYALVTCLNPLRVYLYQEGLVRFASEPFTLHRSKLRCLLTLKLDTKLQVEVCASDKQQCEQAPAVKNGIQANTTG